MAVQEHDHAKLDALVEKAISEFRSRCQRYQRNNLWGPVEIKAVFQQGKAEAATVADNMTMKRS